MCNYSLAVRCDDRWPPQVAGLTTMLSAKGRVCNNKVYILSKMQTLRDRLQGYIEAGAQKVQQREAEESAAKSAWLDSESQYVLAKKQAEHADAAVAQDLKKVASLSELLVLNKARLAKVRASTTEQLSEIDEEEAIIRELLGYIGDLHSSTVDVVRAPNNVRERCRLPARAHPVHRVLFVPSDRVPTSHHRAPQDVSSLSQKFGQGVDQLMQRPSLRNQAASLQAFAQ
jgi:hypothetical protein